MGDAIGCDLEESTYGHDSCSVDDGFFPAPFLSPNHGGDSPKETTNIVDSSDGTKKCGIIVEIEGVKEILGDNNAA